MDPIMIVVISIMMLFTLILLGFHIGASLMASSIFGLWLITGRFSIALSILRTTAYSSLHSYALATVPVFILMGLLCNTSNASADLYDTARLMLRRIRGGLGIATVIANAIFAAITGSSVVSAAVFSKVSLPQMRKAGYETRFALGIVAGSSVLGMMIPPSVLMIIYGTVTGEAIGKLFIAGIIPGLVLAAIYSIGIMIMAKMSQKLTGEEDTNLTNLPQLTKREILQSLIKPWKMFLLIIIVLGGIYTGFFTPTEAGAVGAIGSIILFITSKEFSVHRLWGDLIETGYTTGSIMYLLIGANMYAAMLARSGLSNQLVKIISEANIPGIVIVFLFIVIYAILGCILDSISIILLMVPLTMPIVVALGYDLIWYGVVAVVATELGLLTPPFGMSIYTIKSSLGDQVELEDIFIGSVPFFLMMLGALVLYVLFPRLSTWLPSLM